MDQGHTRASALQLQRGLRGGAAPADDGHGAVVVGVSLVEAMHDLGQLLARHPQPPRPVEEAGGDHDGARGRPPAPRSAHRGDHESFSASGLVPLKRDHPFVLPHPHREALGHAPVVLDRLRPRRLARQRRERHPRQLQPLRRREEHHVAREVEDRVDQAALLQQHVVQAGRLGLNRAGQAGRARADDDEVVAGDFAVSVCVRV